MSQSPFTPEQIAQLDQPLDPKRVKHRSGGGGMQLSYLKGHDAIDTANRIFGYGNWGYDLVGVEMQNVLGEDGGVIGCYYAARVKLSVVGCVPVTEEGVCPVQEGRNPRARIDAHDMARKGAITDALKRALRCFGDQFGNSLYDNELVDGQPRETVRNNNTRNPNQPQAANGQPSGLNRPANNAGEMRAPRMAPVQPPVSPAPVSRPVAPAQAPAPVNHETATEQQRQAILKMAARREMDKAELEGRLQELYGYGLDGLTKNDASHFIKVFQDQAA
jgi:DNA repair and recombination protein RAD52